LISFLPEPVRVFFLLMDLSFEIKKV